MTHSKRRAGVHTLAAALAIALAAVPALAGDTPAVQGTVNVNTASLEELQLLPGIGESRARAVIAERKRRGGFKRVDDLREVKGIGETSLDQMRPYVTVQGKTTARRE